jgi:hypothetical protein
MRVPESGSNCGGKGRAGRGGGGRPSVDTPESHKGQGRGPAASALVPAASTAVARARQGFTSRAHETQGPPSLSFHLPREQPYGLDLPRTHLAINPKAMPM